jgi:hypothetical protein
MRAGLYIMNAWIIQQFSARLEQLEAKLQEPGMQSQTSLREEFENSLRPGRHSALGFLGSDEKLEEVISQDAAMHQQIGLTFVELGEALAAVLNAVDDQREQYNEALGKELESAQNPDELVQVEKYHEWRTREETLDWIGIGHPMPGFGPGNLPDTKFGYLVGDRFQVFVLQWRGMQECPWGCGFPPGASYDFLLLNRETGTFVTGPGMITHLIREHHFCEGRESPYRVDPIRLARVLGLVPEHNERTGNPVVSGLE